MITDLRIRNFKAWRDTGPVRLAPLTFLFGTNSSGTSSLNQFLLMLQQTAERRASGSRMTFAARLDAKGSTPPRSHVSRFSYGLQGDDGSSLRLGLERTPAEKYKVTAPTCSSRRVAPVCGVRRRLPMLDVVDTNVALVTKLPDDDPEALVAASEALLADIIETGRIVVTDVDGEILEEYFHKLNRSGAPSLGDAFGNRVSEGVWSWNDEARVNLGRRGEHDYAVLGGDDAGIDSSDRKFVGTAKVSGAPVHQATDTKWLDRDDVVVEEKVDGENLGLSWIEGRLRCQARGSYVDTGGGHFVEVVGRAKCVAPGFIQDIGRHWRTTAPRRNRRGVEPAPTRR